MPKLPDKKIYFCEQCGYWMRGESLFEFWCTHPEIDERKRLLTERTECFYFITTNIPSWCPLEEA